VNEELEQVKAAMSGDRNAFNILVQRYQRQAVAVASRMLGNIDDGLEVAQEAFIRAFQAMEQLKEPNRFKSWLMRIVVNRALNFRRDRSRYATLSLSETYSQDQGESQISQEQLLEGKEPMAYENLEAVEMADALQKAIDELPENLRTALVLFSLEKLPQKEIADIMKCSLQTVKWNVFEARKRLRARLKHML
jgi:RNA polymerase sigma-70 factor (ECF subfamily)